MKKFICLIITLFISVSFFSQNLKVSKNGRYFEKKGIPFLWIGDTGWELFHKLNREEATHYLETRAKQGFTVIQAVVLAENDGLRKPNSYGEVPFINLDPEKPNEKYFEHVDFIVNKANELGLVIGLLPTWGDKLYSMHPAAGPIVFNRKNAQIFGEYLGKRYEKKEIVWILGGDRNVDSFEVLEIWRAMAAGLKKGDKGKHLMSFHPRGESSSSYFLHNEDWLDFNIYQSGHARRYNPTYEWAMVDYLNHPVKPFVDGEPAYEYIPIRFWEYCDWTNPKRVPGYVLNDDNTIKDTAYFKDGFFNDYDVRIHAYWNFLAGAAGYTYGNNAVWQMFKKGGEIAIPCLSDWKDALNHKGASQLINLNKLFKIYSIANLLTDQSVIYGINPKGENHIRAAISTKNDWAFVYLSQGQKVNVVMSKIHDENVSAFWFNPRDGKKIFIGEFKNNKIEEFIPPTNGISNDWLLILESKKANFSI
ncbi:MAG: glycoside hydrolase family 140 protein [Bacteroidales bacterium]|nr:glycoside hydrolase family 140 protein [Bacteroidales bacterium]